MSRRRRTAGAIVTSSSHGRTSAADRRAVQFLTYSRGVASIRSITPALCAGIAGAHLVGDALGVGVFGHLDRPVAVAFVAVAAIASIVASDSLRLRGSRATFAVCAGLAVVEVLAHLCLGHSASVALAVAGGASLAALLPAVLVTGVHRIRDTVWSAQTTPLARDISLPVAAWQQVLAGHLVPVRLDARGPPTLR